LLCDLKKANKTRNWLKYIEDNFVFCGQTARNYMRVFKRRDEPKFKTVLNLKSAYRLLADPESKSGGSDPDYLAILTAMHQEEGKQTALAETAAVAKQQAEKAKADYEEAEKLSAETLRTVQKLQGDLAAAVAQNTALQSIHDQTSAANRAAQNADIVNRVNAGRGTPHEIEEVQAQQAQSSAEHERGPDAGLDAANAVARGREIVAGLNGQRGAAVAGHIQEIHSVLDQIVGFLDNQSPDVRQMRSDLLV
jgi:hypothetical protein